MTLFKMFMHTAGRVHNSVSADNYGSSVEF